MIKTLRTSILLFLMLSLLFGLAYPSLVWFVGNLFFADQAQGSLVFHRGKIVGSTLIAQNFTKDRYFWPRPSATGVFPYNFLASGASNLGPTNPALFTAVQDRIEKLRTYPHPPGPVPVDLVTTSGSGLDPHISPEAAAYQIPRIAQARELPIPSIERLVSDLTEHRSFGIFGEPRVNVLKLNMELDRIAETAP